MSSPSLSVAVLCLTVRNKDNSWPEEMIKLLKELKAKEKKKQSHTDSTATVGKHMHGS